MGKVDPATSRFLDGARWMAAWAVLVAHVCTLVMQTGGPGAPETGAVLVMGYLANVGHLAVVIFFVVSGYLVGGQEALRVLAGRPLSIRRFAIQRFSRIYTVLVPALVMTSVLDGVGQAWFDGSGVYRDPPPPWMHPIGSREGLGTFLGNLANLQTIRVDTLGSNGPLWSLANEWWYYVAYGLLLVAGAAHRGAVWRIAALAGAVAVIGALPAEVSLWFLLWLFGVGVALVGRRWAGLRFGVAIRVMGAGFLVALLGMRLTELVWAQPRWVLNLYSLVVDGIAAMAFAVGLLSARRAVVYGDGRMHHELAGFSFSLYAVHYPALLLLLAMAHDVFGVAFVQPVGWAGFAVSAGVIVLVVGYAWVFAALTERHTGAVRAALTRWLAGTDGVARSARPEGRAR